MNVLIILGHPSSDSFCHTLSERYKNTARAIGHNVRLVKLGEITFDPVLHRGYQQSQELEPELQALQDSVLWANHLVFVYPTWWGAMPALLKGFFDRVFLPGFAFRYRKHSKLCDKLLKGRSADVITTMDTPGWYYRFIYRMPGHNQIKRTILEFSGISPVKITAFDSVRSSTPETRSLWLDKTEQLAKRLQP